jgi:hypothetical protein
MTIEYKDSKRIVTSTTEYKVHTFLNSTDNFQITAGSGDVEYLVIGGGGGGGSSLAGGAGAGAYRTATLSLSTSTGSSGTHTVTIGAGGAGATSAISGANGSNSIFDTITSEGGGGGAASGSAGTSRTGASAGGGANGGAGGTGGTYGNNGGSGSGANPYAVGGGGGGAGTAGTNGTGSSGSGIGGNGLSSDINGTATFRAGGGGGATYNGGTGGAGGTGGGGQGGSGAGGTGTVGTANTGSGGGGGSHNSGSDYNGGNGGSGIVIVKYNSNDITATGGTITTITETQSKPTNVQDNSILVEKDTGKRYWLTGESAFTPEQLVNDSSTSIMSQGNESDAGINIKAGSVFIGKTISQVSFLLKQEVNPVSENLVYCRLYRSGSFVHTFGTTDPDNITVGSFGWYSFGTSGDADAGNGSVTLEEGDRILVSWDRGGAYNDTALGIAHSTSDVHDGTATNFIKLQAGTWTEYDAKDACFKIVGTTPATWALEFFNPTDTTLFSTSTGWTGDTSVITNSGDTMVWDTSVLGEAVVKTITTLPASGEWVLRFKVTKVSGDAGDGSFLTLGSSSASTSTLARMQNGNGLYPYGLHVAYFANSNRFYVGSSHNTSFAWDSVSDDGSVTWSAGDTKWVEVSHASATTWTTKVYSNANFTGTPDRTYVSSASGQTLDYDEFAIGTKWSANRKNMIIEDMQIWNGVTSPP